MARKKKPEPKPEEATEHLAELVPAEQKLVPLPRRDLSPTDRVAEIQARIFETAHEVIDGVQDFADVETNDLPRDQFGHLILDGDEPPPPKWIERFGEKKAARRYRLAKYGIMSAKEAPVGIKVAEHIATSIARTKAMEKGPSGQLNVAVIYVQGEKKKYPVLEVEE